MALVHSFTFYNAIQWAGLKSLSGQLWPLGLMFDTFELQGIPQKTKTPHLIGSLQSPAVVEVHPVPMGQWGGQMLLADWFAETLEEGPWEAGCHSGPGTWLERHVGTALMIDLKENERERRGKMMRAKS